MSKLRENLAYSRGRHEEAEWENTTVSQTENPNFPLVPNMCLQNTKTSIRRVKPVVIHSDFCSVREHTWSHLQLSESLTVLLDIANLRCFFHVFQCFDYMPDRNTTSFHSKRRQRGTVWFADFVCSLVFPFSVGQC